MKKYLVFTLALFVGSVLLAPSAFAQEEEEMMTRTTKDAKKGDAAKKLKKKSAKKKAKKKTKKKSKAKQAKKDDGKAAIIEPIVEPKSTAPKQ